MADRGSFYDTENGRGHYGLRAYRPDPADILHQMYAPAPPASVRTQDNIDQARAPNDVHQADLLFLPLDRGSRYALVVVDAFTRKTAAVAISRKSAGAVLQGFERIYAEADGFAPPKRLEVDGGPEFYGVVRRYFDEHNTHIRYGRTGRHRQQALAENANGRLGAAIMMKEAAEELNTGRVSRRWKADLPGLVAHMNADARQAAPPPPPAAPFVMPPGNNPLEEGTEVRVADDEPHDVLGRRAVRGPGGPAHGPGSGFRRGDPRWSARVHRIVQVIYHPGANVRYIVDGIPGAAFARGELQVVPARERRLPPRPRP